MEYSLRQFFCHIETNFEWFRMMCYHSFGANPSSQRKKGLTDAKLNDLGTCGVYQKKVNTVNKVHSNYFQFKLCFRESYSLLRSINGSCDP